MSRRLSFLSALLALVPLLASASSAQLRPSSERYGLRSTQATWTGPAEQRLTAGSAHYGRRPVIDPRGLRATRYGAAARPIWVPGHYQQVPRRVWVPARTERIWVEPVYRYQLEPCGNTIRILVRAGCWRTVTHPGTYDTRTCSVWVPGRWVVR